MEPFGQMINEAKKYVVSNTLEQVDWNAELVRGDLGTAVEQLKRESGTGLFVGGVKLPLGPRCDPPGHSSRRDDRLGTGRGVADTGLGAAECAAAGGPGGSG